MAAMLVDDANPAARVTEAKQRLTHHHDLLGRAVGLGQFLRQQHR
jgi:alpha-galactosidase/6-phospho-beta-glucosidase family protein